MIATPERRKHVRARRDIICGRRNCARCTRWRCISDYAVTRWWSREKTVPRTISSMCKLCKRLYRIERRHSHPRPRPVVVDRPEIEMTFSRMTLQDRQEYQWEEGIPLARWSNKFADEDCDPTPVPLGCPRCFLHSGCFVCLNCPDIELRHARTSRRASQVLSSRTA